jgi:hypothetical protein
MYSPCHLAPSPSRQKHQDDAQYHSRRNPRTRHHEKKIIFADISINLCKGCRICGKFGNCTRKILAANVPIFAFSQYSLPICSRAKKQIDHYQVPWLQKYVINTFEIIAGRNSILSLFSQNRTVTTYP